MKCSTIFTANVKTFRRARSLYFLFCCVCSLTMTNIRKMLSAETTGPLSPLSGELSSPKDYNCIINGHNRLAVFSGSEYLTVIDNQANILNRRNTWFDYVVSCLSFLVSFSYLQTTQIYLFCTQIQIS